MRISVLTACVLLWGIVKACDADLVVTEFMFSPASDPDTSWEFIELYNNGVSAVDLSGYVLDDNDGDVLTGSNIASGSIAAGGVGILYNAAITATDFANAWGGGLNLIAVTDWGPLENGGDRFALWDSITSYGTRTLANALIDFPFNDSPPWPADNETGSFFLLNTAYDPFTADNWRLSQSGQHGAFSSNPAGTNEAVNVGSPGVVQSVPEPASLALMGVAACSAICLSYRRRTARRRGNPQ